MVGQRDCCQLLAGSGELLDFPGAQKTVLFQHQIPVCKICVGGVLLVVKDHVAWHAASMAFQQQFDQP